MTNSKSGKAAVKVIIYILLVLILLGMFGVIMHFTNGFTSDFTTFYVSIDGKDIMSSTSGYKMSPKNELKVDVKYTFKLPKEEPKDYIVKVIPNAIEGKDFNFKVDGQYYSFQQEKDLTKGFDIVKEKTSFTIKPKGDLLVIMKNIYPTSTVTNCTGNYTDMYTLVVSSYDEKESVEVNFSIVEDISGITLDKEVLEF